MTVSLKDCAQFLINQQRVFILSHQNPDGDTLGSAFALCLALRKMGKQASVLCSDDIPRQFQFLCREITHQEFQPDCIVTVDVADVKLLGQKLWEYSDKIDLCLDHHQSNRGYAGISYVDAAAAAACEIVYALLLEMHCPITPGIADCLYTGIATDTGCFRFSNVTPKTLRTVADLIEAGARAPEINRDLFETKSKARLEVEKRALETMKYYFNGRMAVICITQKMILETGIDPADLDGVAAIPRQVEGVEVGVTMRERPEGGYRVSVRTSTFVDASAVCAVLGGGGHIRAAGCAISAPEEEARKKLLAAVLPYFPGNN